MTLIEYLEQHNIVCDLLKNQVFVIPNFGRFLFVSNKDQMISEEFGLCLTKEEGNTLMLDEEINYFCFEFGNKFYYSKVGEDLTLTPLEYLSTSTDPYGNFSYLGIHTGFEICGAVGMPEKVVAKGKFMQVTSMGISQRCTLNGVIDFQRECDKQKIKPILGILVIVDTYEVILYAKNKKGWKNILNIHSQFSVFNKKSITSDYLCSKAEGLICVMGNWWEFQDNKKYIKTFGDDLYFKIDLVEWKNDERDKKHLLILQKYYQNYIDQIKPVLISESFYLEKYQAPIKKFLNSINNTPSYDSETQYMKSFTEVYELFHKLFSKDEKGDFFLQCFDNTIEIEMKCDFKIDLGQKYLPHYEMTQEQQMQYEDTDAMFWDLIAKGMEQKIVNKNLDVDEYLARVDMEYDVLKRGGVIDYFLILWDACRFMREADIMYGYGRGSAAGSVVSYLFDLVKLDPIKFNLLFERFLNEARLQSSLPDIDTDIQGDRRDEVKEYFRQKYGRYRVAEVGNYQNIKLKSGITDIAKHFGMNNVEVKFLTSLITKDYEDGTVTDLFKLALKEEKIKRLIQEFPDIVEYLECIMFHPRSRGVHASATIIVPKDADHENFFDWAPTEAVDGNLVTQWDGIQLEAIGYLKEDLLGLAQLDKWQDMLKLIKKDTGDEIHIEDVPLDDDEVFRYFHEGLNEDVFQFTSPSQKQYTKYLRPDNIEELIAANALYRPGPMDTGAHNKFVKIKYHQEEPEYDPYLEEVLKPTFGLFVYQEQTMKAFQIVTNATLVESDNFRKFVSKLMGDNQSNDKYLKYEKQFIEGYWNNWKIPKEQAQYVWNKIVAFATYGFNRSHAAAYAITGYITQWLKVYYPTQYWVTSLNRSKIESISSRLNEINKAKVVTINPPDINFSNEKFTYDQNNNIYWAITTIKQAGDKSVEKLFEERNKNGQYYSFEEFYVRCKASKIVNKAVLLNLILCGCFDKLEKVRTPKDRRKIVEQYEKLSGERFREFDEEKFKYDYPWELLTKDLCEYDNIDYVRMLDNTFLRTSPHKFASYFDIMEFNTEDKMQYSLVTAGIIKEINVRITKTKKRITTMQLDQNNNFFNVVLWNEISEKFRDKLNDSVIGRIIYLSGNCALDTYREINSVYSFDKTQIQII